MSEKIARREFLQKTSSVALSASIAAAGMEKVVAATAAEPIQATGDSKRPIRLGVIGLGGRGLAQVNLLGLFSNVTVAAVCDLKPDRVEQAQKQLTAAGKPQPAVYGKDFDDYKNMLARDDIDAVVISTPWDLHARMAVDSMKAGKFTGVETPIALTIEECWEVVKTHESTGAACMMFENWAFRRDNLAVLNMIRAGLFGQIVHGHCSYSHNCVYWLAAPERPWTLPHFIDKNASQYSTHGMGPMISWMDINCGDRIDYIVSVASKPLGMRDQLTRTYGAEHPLAKQNYNQGDIVTTTARTVQGKTFVVNCDILLPRPYDNRWMIQGTRGLYNEQNQSVYVEGVSPAKDSWEPFAPYEKKYDHRFWKSLSEAERSASHGGTDFVVMNEFLRAVRNRAPSPLSVYDSVAMCVINPLSGKSIADGSRPVKCPDFTGGKWDDNSQKFAADA